MATHVVDLEELYKLIPETRKLQTTNFINLKDLLTRLIEAIEKTNQWEFIQYINNKPSIFVIRSRSNNNINSNLEQSVLKELEYLKQNQKTLYNNVNDIINITRPLQNIGTTSNITEIGEDVVKDVTEKLKDGFNGSDIIKDIEDKPLAPKKREFPW